jgi:hypothetical protein
VRQVADTILEEASLREVVGGDEVTRSLGDSVLQPTRVYPRETFTQSSHLVT